MFVVDGPKRKKTLEKEGGIMKQVSIKVPIYDWQLTFITIVDENDATPMNHYIDKFLPKLPREAKDHIIKSVSQGDYNGGETLTSMSSKKAVIIIFRWSEEHYFYNVLNHEKRHVVDNILEDAHINDKEAAAYLDGYISAELSKQLQVLK